MGGADTLPTEAGDFYTNVDRGTIEVADNSELRALDNFQGLKQSLARLTIAIKNEASSLIDPSEHRVKVTNASSDAINILNKARGTLALIDMKLEKLIDQESNSQMSRRINIFAQMLETNQILNRSQDEIIGTINMVFVPNLSSGEQSLLASQEREALATGSVNTAMIKDITPAKYKLKETGELLWTPRRWVEVSDNSLHPLMEKLLISLDEKFGEKLIVSETFRTRESAEITYARTAAELKPSAHHFYPVRAIDFSPALSQINFIELKKFVDNNPNFKYSDGSPMFWVDLHLSPADRHLPAKQRKVHPHIEVLDPGDKFVRTEKTIPELKARKAVLEGKNPEPKPVVVAQATRTSRSSTK